jgi:hypothetical protein
VVHFPQSDDDDLCERLFGLHEEEREHALYDPGLRNGLARVPQEGAVIMHLLAQLEHKTLYKTVISGDLDKLLICDA